MLYKYGVIIVFIFKFSLFCIKANCVLLERFFDLLNHLKFITWEVEGN